MRKYLDLSECLFDVFANPDYTDPQQEKYMWAIREGVNRIALYPGYPYNETRARKDHDCQMGHKISNNDIYFQYLDHGWGSGIKFCARCIALILYVSEVHNKPPYMFTKWDTENQTPSRKE